MLTTRTLQRLTLAAWLLTCSAIPALACSITVTEPVKYAFKAAQVVFEGTLERIDADGTLHYVVHRQWKGAPRERVTVANPQTSCGYHDGRVGERYIVIPDASGMVDGGSHVRRVSSAGALLKLLDSRASWWRCPLSSFTPRAIASRLRRGQVPPPETIPSRIRTISRD